MVISLVKYKTIIDLVRWRERIGYGIPSMKEVNEYKNALRQARAEHGVSVTDIKKHRFIREEKFYKVFSAPVF